MMRRSFYGSYHRIELTIATAVELFNDWSVALSGDYCGVLCSEFLDKLQSQLNDHQLPALPSHLNLPRSMRDIFEGSLVSEVGVSAVS